MRVVVEIFGLDTTAKLLACLEYVFLSNSLFLPYLILL